MDHWNNTLPDFVYEINYEEIIKNSESEIKKLIKNLNLNWDKKCLKFYKTKRTVKTASDTQIRNRIYKSSVGYWRNFQPFMNDFFENLPN